MGLLNPNKGDNSNDISRRRSLLRNPFAGRNKADPTDSLSSRSPFSISRALSTIKKQQPQSAEIQSPPAIGNPALAIRAASPPPAYSEGTTSVSGLSTGAYPVCDRYSNGAHPAISVQAASTAEDPYAFLSSFDTVFLIDDSGSMSGRSWREAEAVMAAIVPICTAHDQDGIDIYFMNHKTRETLDQSKGSAGTGHRGVQTLSKVQEIFSGVSPTAQTPTGTRLQDILRPYLALYEMKVKSTGDETCLRPLNIIVITDGEPSDDVEGWIINTAKKLDKLEAPPYQIGIQFFQVGNMPGASDALRQLDDELSQQVEGGIRDIVDTVSFDYNPGGSVPTLTVDGMLKTVLGSVVKRLDRKPTTAASGRSRI